MAPRLRFLLLLVAGFCAQAAAAQESPVVNRPDLDPALFAATRGEVVADTTEPWRYFPLGVGDAWEFYHYQTGVRRRVDVLGEETHNGIGYVSWRTREVQPDGTVWNDFTRPVRYDTVSARVRMYIPSVGQEADNFPWAPCRLDADFGEEVLCQDLKSPFEVSGSFEGALVFGGAFPGEGTDTLRTAVKRYYSFSPGFSFDFRFAAGIGYVFQENELGEEGIYYARVGGVEYGEPQLTVSAESAPGSRGPLALSAWPNPFRERVTVAFTLGEAAPVVVELVDVLGRVVVRRDLGVLAAGEYREAVGALALAPGSYVVRVRRGGEVAVSRVLTAVR